MTGKLEIGPDGRVTGPVAITYNNPFPTRNGSWGSGAMMGVVMHTMVGNLQPTTVDLFNSSSAAVSAHFGIAQDGSVWQFGPIGKGWIAWAEMAGNEAWYSIEHADNGNTENPLTDAQLTASAQLVEVLSRFAGFPLQVTVTDTPPLRAESSRASRSASPGCGVVSWPPVRSTPSTRRNSVRPASALALISPKLSTSSGGGSAVL